MEKGITLASLAKELNTTPVTVSKVLNGKKDVGLEMRQKVLALAKKRHYTPNFAAKKLKSNSHETIGVIITCEIQAPWYGQLIGKLEEKLAENNQNMILALGKNDPGKIKNCFQSFMGGMVSGIIVGPVLHAQDAMIVQEYAAWNLPIIAFNTFYRANISNITLDLTSGAKTAIDYFFDHGHRNIAYLCCPMDNSSQFAYSRLDGFKKSFQEHGIACNIDQSLIKDSGSRTTGYLQMKKLLHLPRQKWPSAIFCHNDETALGAFFAILEHGLRVPDDFSIIGFDDIAESSEITPKLTSIGGVMDELSTGLVNNINRLIEKNDGEIIEKLITPKILVRESVKNFTHSQHLSKG